MARPSSTYRLQIRPEFDLDAARETLPYLRDLGAGWAYLSPLLRATTGSDHGYDVVDHGLVDPARGGAAALERFAVAAHEEGLGVLVDIVPNHVGVSAPRENPWWWDALRRGAASPHFRAFDVDAGARILVPALDGSLESAVAAGIVRIDPEPAADAPDGVVRAGELVLPLAPDTAGGDALAVLGRQHYRIAPWRSESSELTYRRFFAVSTLAGLRVEDPEVFAQTHAEIVRWVREGWVDGLRVDHPDGLRDPGGYLARLDAELRAAVAGRAASGAPFVSSPGSAPGEGERGSVAERAERDEAAGGAPFVSSRRSSLRDRGMRGDAERAEAPREPYVVVEKILEQGETLPATWATAGTTGYDALAEIDRVLVDPAGEVALDALDARLRRESGLPPATWPDLVHDGKRAVADTLLVAEVRRIVRALPHPVPRAEDALAELLACFPVYRSYLPAGIEHLHEAVEEALHRRPDLVDPLAALLPVLADAGQPAALRFEQTTGPVMAKGVEDGAFYRWTRLGTLTEVGGDPGSFALSVTEFHAAQAARQAAWPAAMTTLSTHDTKRGEDVRARLSVLAEAPERWAATLDALRGIASTGDGPLDALLWQAIVGAWPASEERLHAYAEKATREAGGASAWTDPDAAKEERAHALVAAAHGAARPLVEAFVAEIAAAGRANGLAAKLLQLTGPGVPDVYQGSEGWERSLVDPDNRRAVDFAARTRLLAEVDEAARRGAVPAVDESGAAKLLVTSRALRLRRDRPGLFTRYAPLAVQGSASDHAVAIDRGGAVVLATRLPLGLARRGWGGTVALLPEHPLVDVLTGRAVPGGPTPLAALLADLPVALLIPAE